MIWTPPIAALADVVGPIGYEPVLRIALAAALGGMIGWERERHGRAAGLRTHMLLCVGCTLIMLVSLYLPTRFADSAANGVIRADPGRIAAHVLSGLGFLGAGAIIVVGQRIRGLTTAACIWVTAAIGLAVGCGYLFPAALAFAVVMFALHVLGRWERQMTAKDQYVRLALEFSQPAERIERVRELLAAHSLDLLHYTLDWRRDCVVYRMQLRYARPVNFEQVTADLAEALGGQELASIEWT